MIRTAPKRCVAIINPAAVGASGRTHGAWLRAAPLVRRMLQQDGFELVERFTAAPSQAVQLAAEAVASGADAVLAVGGDGTIHEVVTGMMVARCPHSHQQQAQQQQQDHALQPSATALGVLPLGTGSDFKRTFGWVENDIIAACQRITGGQRQPLDVGRVNIKRSQHCSSSSSSSTTTVAVGSSHRRQHDQRAMLRHHHQPQQQQQQQQSHLGESRDAAVAATDEVKYFVNVMSCGAAGATAEIVHNFKLLGTLAYPIAAAVSLLRYKSCTVQVSCDGGSWQTLEQLTLLVIGNGIFWGGGMRVLPAASTLDGLMDVLSVQRMGLVDFVTKGHLLRSGKYEGLPGVTVLPCCKTLAVRALGPTSSATAAGTAAPMHIPKWEIDGEAQGQCGQVTIEMLPGALQLCI